MKIWALSESNNLATVLNQNINCTFSTIDIFSLLDYHFVGYAIETFHIHLTIASMKVLLPCEIPYIFQGQVLKNRECLRVKTRQIKFK